MIDEEITYEEKGYRSIDLKPQSNKRVWAVCDNCGKGRWVQFYQYRDLCYKCAKEKSRKYNYDDIENVVRSIDEEKTYKEKGYRSVDLSIQSHKKVYAICIGCGKGRWLIFGDYRDLCQKCACRTVEARRKNSEAQKGKTASDETKQKLSKAKKGRTFSDEHKRKIGESRYGKCHTIEAREKMRKHHADVSGENNPNWQEGISFGEYCEKFNEKFKESIREKFGRKCFICSTTEEDNGRKLCVHHVSYDKECMCNGVECEFVPLCMRCHAKTGYDKELWERLIINVLSYEEWI